MKIAPSILASDLADLASGTLFASASEVEAAVFRTTRAVLDRGTLTGDEFSDAVAVLGEDGLFELVTIVGWYTMVAWQMAVFDVQPS